MLTAPTARIPMERAISTILKYLTDNIFMRVILCQTLTKSMSRVKMPHSSVKRYIHQLPEAVEPQPRTVDNRL